MQKMSCTADLCRTAQYIWFYQNIVLLNTNVVMLLGGKV